MLTPTAVLPQIASWQKSALEVAELDLSFAILGIIPETLGLEIFQQKWLVIMLAVCQCVPHQEAAGIMATP